MRFRYYSIKIKRKSTKGEGVGIEAKKFGRDVSEPRIKKYDNVYNGKLRIVFDDSSYIRDGAEVKLEDRLKDMLQQLYERSEENRIEWEKREEQHRLYLEQKQREEEQKQRRKLEMEKTQALENIAKDYQIACQIAFTV